MSRRPLPPAVAAVAAALAGAVAPPPAPAATTVTALPPPSPPRLATIVPGVSYERMERDGGQVVHVVRVRPGARQAIAPVLAGGSPRERGALTDAIRARRGGGAVAGINGDFFNFEHGHPSGLLLSAGELVSEPEAGRSSLVISPDRRLAATRLAFAGRYEVSDPSGLTLPGAHPLDAMNRPAAAGSETILYTTAFGAAATPEGGSLFEARVRLDEDRPFAPNDVRGGTVVGTGAGGGTTIGAGHAVLTGVGAAGRDVAQELRPGLRVALHTGVEGLAPGTLDAIGGGPLLVRDGRPVHSAGEGFSDSQLFARTSRSAVGQTAAGTILLVTAEGPRQGRPGVTVAEQADLMAELGSTVAIGMDGGGSAQLAVGDDLVIPWDSPRRISTALLVSYQGVHLPAPPFRISPNGDGVDDRVGVRVGATSPGQARVTLVSRPGHRTTRLLDARLGPGTRPVRIDPLRLGAPDGVYLVIARHVPDDGSPATTQRRRVIVDRTLSHLAARPARVRSGKRRRPILDVGFRLRRPAAVTVQVRTESGRLVRTLASGRRLDAGRHRIRWNRRARGELVTGGARVSVAARTRLGQTGLQQPVRLRGEPSPSGG